MPIYTRYEGIKSIVSATSSMVSGFRPDNFYRAKKYIYAVRGDNVVRDLEIDSIALIKIDVEGAELEVIRGLRASIENYSPYILFEVLHHYLAVTKEVLEKDISDFRESRIQELEEILRSHGYKIYQIHGAKALMEVEKISPKYINELETTNYLAIPKDKAQSVCQSLALSRSVLTFGELSSG
jgi:Methyltransferase FkbM domain